MFARVLISFPSRALCSVLERFTMESTGRYGRYTLSLVISFAFCYSNACGGVKYVSWTARLISIYCFHAVFIRKIMEFSKLKAEKNPPISVVIVARFLSPHLTLPVRSPLLFLL